MQQLVKSSAEQSRAPQQYDQLKCPQPEAIDWIVSSMENCYSLLVFVAQDQQTILHQTFTHHWEACRDRIRGYEPGGDR